MRLFFFKRRFWYFVLFTILIIPGRAICGEEQPKRDLSEYKKQLSLRINSCLKKSRFSRVNYGIKIVTTDGKHILYQHQPDISFIPASVTKIISSGVGLVKFGADFQFETRLLTDGEIRSGELKGNLYMQGKGDPALNLTHLESVAKHLKNMGIQIISGDVIYDVSFLDEESSRYPPNARHLFTPPCAITVNYNWIILGLDESNPPRLWTIPQTAYARLKYDIQVSRSFKPGLPRMTFKKTPSGDIYMVKGRVTDWDKQYKTLRLCVSRPGLYGATLLKESCQKVGIRMNGSIRKGKVPVSANTLKVIRTRKLLDIIRILNQESNNVVAELVNKNLGAYFDSIPGTRAKGLAVIRNYCEDKIGFKKGRYHLRDASGLSVGNRFSATQMTLTLNHFYKNLGMTYIKTLAPQGHHPHARFPVPPKGIKMFVKSGTLPTTGVNTVAGYIILKNEDEVLSFCVLANRKKPGPKAFSGTFTNSFLREIIQAFKAAQ
jgi:D-alanyl-D-alanine carboxypeptidase/D-alanyl-D-alanine-endopeptidase (penicillin-binding protein 4)